MTLFFKQDFKTPELLTNFINRHCNSALYRCFKVVSIFEFKGKLWLIYECNRHIPVNDFEV